MNSMKYFFGLFLLFGTGMYTMAQSFEVKRNGIALVYDQLAGTYSISKDKIILIKDAIAYARLAVGTSFYLRASRYSGFTRVYLTAYT